MKRETVLEKLPRTIWVWSGLAFMFTGFVLFWAPQLLFLRAIGFDRERLFAARFASSGFRAFLAWNAGLGRVRVEIPRGLEHRGPFVVVANHESFLDSFVLLAKLPMPLRMTSKAEIRKIPMLGAAAEVVGVIFGRSADDEEGASLVEAAAGAVRAGASVAFFPEGTRSRGRGILRFRRGAFDVARATGARVLPVVLAGTGEFMPPSGWTFGELNVRLRVLEPRAIEGDDMVFRKALRDEMARVHAELCETKVSS